MNRLAPIAARVLGALLAVTLALPLAALVLAVRPADFAAAIDRGLWQALAVSVGTSTTAAALVVLTGTPLAFWLARTRGRLARAVELVVRVPTVTPPAVAGVALLAALGHGGLLGDALGALGLRVPFTSAAVVLAQIFVAAPFYVLPLSEAFRALDEELILAARSLGAGPSQVFLRIAVPLAAPALLSGLAVAWARALGEFGATLVFAGNLPGVTQTLPIAIYVGMEGDLGPARAMALVLFAIALGLFLLLRAGPLARRLGSSGT